MATNKHQNDDAVEAHRVALDLLSSADNNSMADVTLVTSDGDRVPASRFVLGARSPVLQKMLYIENCKHLQYSRLVVRAVVEYCCTNKIVGFAKELIEVREVVHLMDCASYLELEGLEKRTAMLVVALLEKDPQKACKVYDEASSSSTLRSLALKTITKFPEKALLRSGGFDTPGVLSLSPSCLETILGDHKMNCEEIILFQALVACANGGSNTSRGGAGLSPKRKGKRMRIAKALVSKCLDLSKIAPSDLISTVAESGLVDASALWTALKDTALRTARDFHQDISFSIRRNEKQPQEQQHPRLLVTDGIEEEDSSSHGKQQAKKGTSSAGYHNSSMELQETDVSSIVPSSDDSSSRCSAEKLHDHHHVSVPSPSRSSKSRRYYGASHGRRDSTKEDDVAVKQQHKSKQNKKSVPRTRTAESGENHHSDRVKGKLVTLAEKFDTLCTCGSDTGADTATSPYQ